MPETKGRLLWCGLLALVLSSCANTGATTPDTSQTPETLETPPPIANEPSESELIGVTPQSNPVRVATPTRRGRLEFGELTEVSGLAASRRQDGVLWAINDSGNEPALYALDDQGQHLGKWPVAAENRDWEDIASVWHNGDAYLLIAETGDNLRLYSEYKIHILQEPVLDATQDALYPLATLSYRYNDGKHNVEAMGVIDDSIILISKEPLAGSTHTPGKAYRLPFQLSSNTHLFEATYLTTLATQNSSLEARLAAALTGVSLNNVTAMDVDTLNRIAYLLTYRHVIKLPLSTDSENSHRSLSAGLSQRGEIIYGHDLHQAEAMTVDNHGQVWLTSENAQAPIWVLPAPPINN